MYINNSSHYNVTMAGSLEFSMNVFSFFKKNERIDIAGTQEKLESSWIWKCGGVRVTTPRSRDFKECQLSKKKLFDIDTNEDRYLSRVIVSYDFFYFPEFKNNPKYFMIWKHTHTHK